MRNSLPTLGATVIALAYPCVVEADPGIEFFEREVRPILVEHCYDCHSADAEKVKGGLYLDSKEGIITGGDSGPALEPGNAEESLLVIAVSYSDPDYEMPPKYRLDDEVVATLTEWVERGAPMPEGGPSVAGESFDLEQRRAEHWCWQPIEKPGVPTGATGSNAIDQLIYARLRGAKLSQAKEAAPRDWLRRATFDITGLPPTPEELTAFEQDISSEGEAAFGNALDRLLASPAYGETWGRHWLDLMRYAESLGHEFDYSIVGPHHYRDYVVRALNADVPYDDFVREHIAGDLLPEPRRHPEQGFAESPIATAFWYLGEAVHAPTDVRGDEAMRMDNMVDVFGKSFLGLTISCARCHDHKFDAISTADYYAMTSYLEATRYHHVPIESIGAIEPIAQQLWEKQGEASALSASSAEDAARDLEQPAAPPSFNLHDGDVLFADFSEASYDQSGWMTTGHAFGEGPLASPTDWIMGRNRPVGASGVAHSAGASRELHGTLRSPDFTIDQKHIHLRMRGEGNPVAVRVIIDGYYMARHNGLLFRSTEMRDKATHLGESDDGLNWKTLNLSKYQGRRAYLEFVDEGDGFVAVDAVVFSEHGAPGIQNPDAHFPPPVPADQVALLDAVREDWEEIEKNLPRPEYTIGVDAGAPEPAFVHIRGKHTKLGEEVPARFLTALGGETQPAPDRLALAESILAPDNPLTSRVIVNRLWHHLFGRGIVPTVDDFGVMGQAPSNPMLLDWLANDFTEEQQWSLKSTIRQICLSKTYRQSSQPHPDEDLARLAELDPENILLSHFPVKRITSEMIRDSVLSVSGSLDRKVGGSGIPVHLTAFMAGRGRPGGGPLDGAGRRSIYLQIRRNFLHPTLQVFGTPQPFSSMGRRPDANVPAQALALLNDPFVLEQSNKWAERINREVTDGPAAQITRMFKEALGRPPTPEEHSSAKQFLQDGAPLVDLAHVLYNHKEFIYLR